MKPSLDSVAAQVREYDNDRYLCALFAPEAQRQALFGLYAFNLEVARIREAVSEPMLGEIRLQWWREALDGIYRGSPRRHETTQALAATIRAYHLPRAPFDALIDARVADLNDEPPASLAALVAYAAGTSSTITSLALTVLGASEQAARRAGEDVGIAWALTGLLRAGGHHARARRLYLPHDRLAATKVNLSDYFELRGSPALNAVVGEVVTEARNRLAAARALRRAVPKAALPALLPAMLAERWLRRVARANGDIFDPRLARPGGLGDKLSVTFAAIRGRY